MKTTGYILQEVYKILTGDGGVECPVYKLKKPSNTTPTEYVVINTLPIDSGVLQKCIINVNYHVQDEGPGQPDMVTLETGTDTLMSLLEYLYIPGMRIDFESQEYIPEESDDIDETYSNIRLKVKLLNT
jgi:hypothetical protein